MKIAFTFILSCILLSPLLAQVPVLKTSVDKKDILIGEQITYTAQATFPEGYTVNWLSIPDSVQHFEVVEKQKIDTVASNGNITLTQQIILTSFDSGRNMIPSFPVNFISPKDHNPEDIFTDSIPINVGYSPLDSVKTFHDIKTVLDVKEEIPWLLYAAIALGILILIGLILLIIKYLRKKKTKEIFTSRVSPFDEAIHSLKVLQQQKLLESGQVKQYHIKLGEIFRRFISRKMNTNMFNLTSSGILLAMNDTLLSNENTSLLANSLKMEDAVKFAKYMPPVYLSEQSLDDTKKVIEQVNSLQTTNDVK